MCVCVCACVCVRVCARVCVCVYAQTPQVLVYRAVCVTALLYGYEAWTIYSRHLRSLETFHVRCLQKILDITWKDRVPHTEVMEKTGSSSVESIMTRHQLRWLGHVIRMPSHRLPRRILYGQLHLGQRSAGGQKKRLKDQMKSSLKRCQIDPSSLEELASCRDLWRPTPHREWIIWRNSAHNTVQQMCMCARVCLCVCVRG